LEPLREPFCSLCGEPFPGVGPSHLCTRCREQPPPFRELRAWGVYRGALLDAVRRWKFAGDPCLRVALGGLAGEAFRRFWPHERFGAVIPVPCHPATLHRRGFDVPALLARVVARGAGLPWRPRALEKAREIPELVGLDLRARAAAVRGAYRAREALEGGVLLVDDVATSTATARACARACREAGAEWVAVLALARTPREPLGGTS